jgi:ABC-type transporter Mla subunit MlaD
MKNYILFLILLFSLNGLYAQKHDSLTVVNPNMKIIPEKTVNPGLVNQKLLQLQATVKKLEATLKEAKALMDKLKDQKDTISELGQEDMLQLQQLMEKKSQLEQMISNVMKAAAESQNNIAKNLKAS